MTVFNNIKIKNIDELAEWLNNHGNDESPWILWFDKNYCKKCKPVSIDGAISSWYEDYGYCEIHGKCRFFQEMEEVPDCLQMAKMWLESEDDDGV